MFKQAVLLLFVTLLLSACVKNDTVAPLNNNPVDTTDTTDTMIIPADTFTAYLIRTGKNYMENNSYPSFAFASLSFKAIFDSSAIYATADPLNQADINKLMGFADCSSFHQMNSARFGWNWLNNSLRIHAYCYVDGVRQYKELGTVAIGEEATYKLEVSGDRYIFTLNGKRDTMQRHCTDTIANGYKLHPYFGGDEPAPHDIRIRIKEFN